MVALNQSVSPAEQSSPAGHDTHNVNNATLPEGDRNQLRRAVIPEGATLRVQVVEPFGNGTNGSIAPVSPVTVADLSSSTPSPTPSPAPLSADLKPHQGTIAEFNKLIAANNPTQAQSFLNNIISSGMEGGQFKTGHLPAVAQIIKEAIAQSGVSLFMGAAIVEHFKTRIESSGLPANEVVANVALASGQPSGSLTANQGLAAEPMETKLTAQQALDQKVRTVVIDLTMTADQKVAELKSLAKQSQLSSQQLRDSIGRALPDDQNKFVDALSAEQVKKLQADMTVMDDKLGNMLGLWENNGLQRALGRREDALASQQATALQASQQAQALETAQNAASMREKLQTSAADIMLSQQLSAEDKVNSLQKLQRDNKLSDQGMRDLIGEALEKKGTKFVESLSSEQVGKLASDMKSLDTAFGNGWFGLSENNPLQQALGARADVIKQELANQTLAVEQMQAQLAPQNAVSAQALLQTSAANIMLSQDLKTTAKMEALQKLQKDNKLSDQAMRDLIGKALEDKGTMFVEKLSLTEVYKLEKDMKALDKTFRNGIFGLGENNGFQGALETRRNKLIDDL